jgi:pyruvate ferredoxin oxidoreductase beta subunit
MSDVNYDVYAARLVPKEELFSKGHRACQGCIPALMLRQITKATGRELIVCNATGCMEIIASPYPYNAWKVPWIHVAFENTAAVASGVSEAMKILASKGRHFHDRKKKIAVMGIGGDGGTMDIGLQALSGALERGTDFFYVCYDNEAYMNTGIQRSSGTPMGASTTTSPAGKVVPGQVTWKKNFAEIAVAHNIPYVATACPSYPFDLMRKVKAAAAVDGPAVLHIFAPCPTGWRCAGDAGIRLGRLAVESGIFPLYEVIDGKYKINLDIDTIKKTSDDPLTDMSEYFFQQGRFRHLKTKQELLEVIRDRTMQQWQTLKAKAEMSK